MRPPPGLSKQMVPIGLVDDCSRLRLGEATSRQQTWHVVKFLESSVLVGVVTRSFGDLWLIHRRPTIWLTFVASVVPRASPCRTGSWLPLPRRSRPHAGSSLFRCTGAHEAVYVSRALKVVSARRRSTYGRQANASPRHAGPL